MNGDIREFRMLYEYEMQEQKSPTHSFLWIAK